MISAAPVRATLPASPLAPADARRRVAKMCRGLPTSTTETAQLLVSELVTNALIHGQGAIGLLMIRDGALIKVEVSDGSDRPLRPVLHPDPDDESGRGLFLLADLANSWGSEPAQGTRGKTVWFELGRTVAGG